MSSALSAPKRLGLAVVVLSINEVSHIDEVIRRCRTGALKGNAIEKPIRKCSQDIMTQTERRH
jgi:hypothetical protein